MTVRLVGTPVSLPPIHGELTGGEEITILSFLDLAALRSLCAVASSLGHLFDLIRVPELRATFLSLREDWEKNGADYRKALYTRLQNEDVDDLGGAAETQFKELITLAPTDPLGYANLGLIYLRERRYAEADDHLQRARELDPANVEIGLSLAKLYSLTGRRAEAHAILDKLRHDDARNARVLYALAEFEAQDPDSAAPRRQSADVDDRDPLDQLQLALEVAERIWEREDSGADGHRRALGLILGVAEPGSKLELESAEPTLVFTSGSIFFASLARGFGQVRTLGPWLVALFRGEGAAAVVIGRNLAMNLRDERLKHVPEEDAALLTLTNLDPGTASIGPSGAADRTVIFVHGLLSTDIGTFDGFIRELAARVPNLPAKFQLLGWPHDTLTGIPDNSYELAQQIHARTKGIESKMVLVSHSRGGLVARSAAMNLYKTDPNYRRTIKGCITFGTPHDGAELACIAPDEFVGHFVGITAVAGTKNIFRMSDILLYQKQQAGGVIQGIADLCPPTSGGFIADLRNDELNDAGKPAGRFRELPIMAIGGDYTGQPSAATKMASRFFGRGVKHDLVVTLNSSALPSADFRAIMNCSHSNYCHDSMRSSSGIKAAVDQTLLWLK